MWNSGAVQAVDLHMERRGGRCGPGPLQRVLNIQVSYYVTNSEWGQSQRA